MSVWGCHGIQGTFKRRTCYCNHSALNLPLLKDTWQRCIDLCCAALLCNPSTGSSLYEDTSSLSRLAYQVPVPNLPTVTPPFYKVVFQWHYSFIKGLSKHTHLSKHYLIKCITSPAGTMLTSFCLSRVLIYAKPQGQSVSHALRNSSAGARSRWRQLHVEEHYCTKRVSLPVRFSSIHHSSVHRVFILYKMCSLKLGYGGSTCFLSSDVEQYDDLILISWRTSSQLVYIGISLKLLRDGLLRAL